MYKKPIKYSTKAATFGTLKLLTLSPRIPTIDGSKVIPAITATNTTKIAPTPNA